MLMMLIPLCPLCHEVYKTLMFGQIESFPKALFYLSLGWIHHLKVCVMLFLELLHGQRWFEFIGYGRSLPFLMSA
jgi:uncharacterized protein YlaN (UPF0358 family)